MKKLLPIILLLMSGMAYAQMATQTKQLLSLHQQNMDQDLAAAATENAIIQNIINDPDPNAQAVIQNDPDLQETVKEIQDKEKPEPIPEPVQPETPVVNVDVQGTVKQGLSV